MAALTIRNLDDDLKERRLVPNRVGRRPDEINYRYGMAAPQIDLIPVPRGSVRFPLVVRPPRGFKASRPSTWPAVEGRLEYSEGKLLFLPPCGEEQSSVAAAVSWVLVDWARKVPGFDVGGNEAGVMLDGSGTSLPAPPRSGWCSPRPAWWWW